MLVIRTKKKKEFKHNTKDSHQITTEEDKRRREEKRKTYKIDQKFPKMVTFQEENFKSYIVLPIVSFF